LEGIEADRALQNENRFWYYELRLEGKLGQLEEKKAVIQLKLKGIKEKKERQKKVRLQKEPWVIEAQNEICRLRKNIARKTLVDITAYRKYKDIKPNDLANHALFFDLEELAVFIPIANGAKYRSLLLWRRQINQIATALEVWMSELRYLSPRDKPRYEAPYKRRIEKLLREAINKFYGALTMAQPKELNETIPMEVAKDAKDLMDNSRH
jgi:hypothetical protein